MVTRGTPIESDTYKPRADSRDGLVSIRVADVRGASNTVENLYGNRRSLLGRLPRKNAAELRDRLLDRSNASQKPSTFLTLDGLL